MNHSIIAALLTLGSFSVSASVFKCVDARGKQSFQQQPCPETSTASRVRTDGHDWLMVPSGKTIPNSPQFVADISLDMANLKTVGALTLAQFRYVRRRKEPDYGRRKPEETIMYVRYNCAQGRLTSPREKLEELEQEQRYHDYSFFQKHSGAQFPFADNFVVRRVCAGAPPPTP